ncbi:hypothetical protein U1Q18_022293 [Sarracenia purpurea var. burkii]
MQEKKGDMATNTTTSNKNPKKANLLDHHSIKHTVDEFVTEIVTSRGHVEDLLTICLSLTLDSGKYIVFNVILQLIIYTKEKSVILFTYPPPGSFSGTGLVVSSKLPRLSDMYTLTLASADPTSISAKAPVEFTKSVTKWFTKDGILVEGLLLKDVEGLISDYTRESKKSK